MPVCQSYVLQGNCMLTPPVEASDVTWPAPRGIRSGEVSECWGPILKSTPTWTPMPVLYIIRALLNLSRIGGHGSSLLQSRKPWVGGTLVPLPVLAAAPRCCGMERIEKAQPWYYPGACQPTKSPTTLPCVCRCARYGK